MSSGICLTALAPLLFDDDDPAAAEAARPSIVAPAQRSPRAQRKAITQLAADKGYSGVDPIATKRY
jgi:hypothetical protein